MSKSLVIVRSFFSSCAAFTFPAAFVLVISSCESMDSSDVETLVDPSVLASHSISQAWIDPLVRVRATTEPRQRIIVEMGPTTSDTAKTEDPDGDAIKLKPSKLLHEMDSLRRAVKSETLRQLDLATPDTVELIHEYPPFPLIALDVTPAQIATLATLPEVRKLHADREEEAHLASSTPAIATPWFHQNRAKGSGTAVAVLDTPVRYDNGHFGTCSVPGATGCSVAATANFSSQTPAQVIASEDANNKGSHGSNVAAIVLGVAPDTKILGLNVFYWSESANGLRTRVSDQIDALAWVATHASARKIIAVNVSIGGGPDGPGTCNDISRFEAIRTLWEDHGILTVISSGNDRESNAVASPGCISMAVTVGAHFDTELEDYKGSCEQLSPVEREIACFSNTSGMVDLLAPGVFIDAGGYRKSGTSMAAPHVAGAVAAWQSWFLQSEGGFKTPFWMHKRLLVQSSAPHVHVDGRRFQRLAFDQSIRWDYGRAFPYWFRESSGNAIPSNGTFFETSIDVAGQGWNVHSAYLTLDLVHEQPQHLELRLRAPSGKEASFKLPGGQAHFTGVVGRTVLPGAFTSLEGSPVDGKWTLRIRDTVGTKSGNFLQSSIYFTKTGCSPNCKGEACGDDTCGGSCGPLCVIEGTCYASDEKHPDHTCRACKPSSSSSSWTALNGDPCNDGDPCTVSDRCKAGVCVGDEKVCPAPFACEQPGVCNGKTGVCEYAPGPNGQTCSDGDACTVADVCVDGECVGTPITCTPPNPCMREDGCDSTTGACVFIAEPDGTSCPGGACKSGSCVAGQKPSVDGGTDTISNLVMDGDEGGEQAGCGCRMARERRMGIGWIGMMVLMAGMARRRLQNRNG